MSTYLETTYRCPDCGERGDRKDFAVYYCPSEPDRCDGCEIDPDRLRCPNCGHEGRDCEERDEAYEHAASRARLNDFEATGGRDWT